MPTAYRGDENAFDVCIVGSGPVGIALALECESQGLSVVLLEAGGAAVEPDASDGSWAEVADPRRHVPMELAVCRGFGGTSSLWGGRCCMFDDIDFEYRPYVPDSGWPITHADVKPWYRQAAEYLGCGIDQFVSQAPNWGASIGGVSADRLARFSQQPKRGLVYRDEIESRPRISLRLNSMVTGLDLGSDGTLVKGVLVASANPSAVRARSYVLACGGLETTRLLLSTQRKWPAHFGGENGALGRYYMGHVEGTIANIVFENGDDIETFYFKTDRTGTYVQRRFDIDATTQRAEEIQNITFWPDNLPYYDPDHHSGIKSFIFLVAANPLVGRRFVSEAIRLAIVGQEPRRYFAHVLNLLRSPYRTMRDVWDVAFDRYISRRWKPGWLLRTPDNKYVLRYRGEQRPARDSGVRLIANRDAFGLERLFIDLRYSEDDATSVVRAHAVLDKALRANGKGRLEYLYPQAELIARVLEQASDGYHQNGTTRMGADSSTSVVGPDCKVHGLANLFIASSSVFRTSGQANPTLLATALAVRLAHDLARALRQRH